MPTLYVREQGATIRRLGRSALVAGPDGQQLGRIPIHRLDAVVVCGHVQVTTEFLHLCLEEGIPLSILSTRERILGRLVAPAGKDTLRRVQQVRLFADQDVRLRLSRALVSRKIANSIEVLKQADWDRGDEAHAAARTELQYRRRDAQSAQSLESLRGIEGIAARTYFAAFPALLAPSGLPFEGRRRRPAIDPPNALLSLCYVLLSNRLAAGLEAVGLDPGLGFYHEPGHGRPCLAMDLVEPLRAPLADRFVIRTLNRREIAPGDFEPADDGGLRLAKPAFAKLMERWTAFLLEKGGDGLLAGAVEFARRAVETAAEVGEESLPGLAAR